MTEINPDKDIVKERLDADITKEIEALENTVKLLKKRRATVDINEDVSKQEDQQPRKLNFPFFKRKRFMKQPEPIKADEIEGNMLLLMKENGFIEPVHNVKAGEFLIKTAKTEKTIFLAPNKIQMLKYGETGDFVKCWVAHENYATALPEEPLHTAEMFRKVTQKLAMNWRDAGEAAMLQARTRMWLWIIGGVVMAVILLLSTDFGQGLIQGLSAIGKSSTPAVVETVKETASNGAVKVVG